MLVKIILYCILILVQKKKKKIEKTAYYAT